MFSLLTFDQNYNILIFACYNSHMTLTPTLLREKYPRFTYQSYDHIWRDDNLVTTYQYQLATNLTCHHQVIFMAVPQEYLIAQAPGFIDNLVFHLGLIEAFSYWKLTASPLFQINCGNLDPTQLHYWHNLLISGMGEYFYTNQIDFTAPNFVQLQSTAATTISSTSALVAKKNQFD